MKNLMKVLLLIGGVIGVAQFPALALGGTVTNQATGEKFFSKCASETCESIDVYYQAAGWALENAKKVKSYTLSSTDVESLKRSIKETYRSSAGDAQVLPPFGGFCQNEYGWCFNFTSGLWENIEQNTDPFFPAQVGTGIGGALATPFTVIADSVLIVVIDGSLVVSYPVRKFITLIRRAFAGSEFRPASRAFPVLLNLKNRKKSIDPKNFNRLKDILGT